MVKVRKRTQVRGTKDGNKKKKVSESAGEKGEKEVDEFFESARDEELLSEDDERDGGEKGGAASEEEEAEAVDLETADEKRLRLAKAYLNRTREAAAAADVSVVFCPLAYQLLWFCSVVCVHGGNEVGGGVMAACLHHAWCNVVMV